MHIAPSSEKSCNKNLLPNQTELGGWYYTVILQAFISAYLKYIYIF